MERDLKKFKNNENIRRHNTCSASGNDSCAFNFGWYHYHVYNGR